MTVDGFIVWEEYGAQPLLINLHRLGSVPFWIASWQEMQISVIDDYLTMEELEAMQSLMVGTATNCQEMLQPDHPDTLDGIIEYNAKGMLEDGRSFNVHAMWNNVDNFRVRIESK